MKCKKFNIFTMRFEIPSWKECWEYVRNKPENRIRYWLDQKRIYFGWYWVER